MSEVSLYCRVLRRCTYRLNTDEFISHDGDPLLRPIYLEIQGYLAYEKQRPPRTLQQDYA